MGCIAAPLPRLFVIVVCCNVETVFLASYFSLFAKMLPSQACACCVDAAVFDFPYENVCQLLRRNAPKSVRELRSGGTRLEAWIVGTFQSEAHIGRRKRRGRGQQ